MIQPIETERLILREIIPTDDERLFVLDSDPEVHRYLGNNPVKEIQQVRDYIQFIRQQYIDFGIGRWAVIEKESNLFIGWSGIKYYNFPINNHVHFYELGYRLIPEFWGKGYATESARAWIKYGFENFETQKMYAMTDIHNQNSKNVLTKVGFIQKGSFDYEDDPKQPCNWFELSKEEGLH